MQDFLFVFGRLFTLRAFAIGVVAAVIIRIFFLDPTMPVVGVFYSGLRDTGNGTIGYLYNLAWVTPLGLSGLGIMWLSSRLDFVDPEEDAFPILAAKCLKLAAATWILALFVAGVYTLDSPSSPGGTELSDIPLLLLFAALNLVALLAFPLFLAAWFIFPPLCLAWVIGGGLSIARALTFLVTRHKLRGTYERGQRRAEFNANEVGKHLGGKSASQAESRALLKDSIALLATARDKASELNQELNGLSQKVRDDTQRLEIEAELSKTLAEIEETKIKIDVLKRKAGGADE